MINDKDLILAMVGNAKAIKEEDVQVKADPKGTSTVTVCRGYFHVQFEFDALGNLEDISSWD